MTAPNRPRLRGIHAGAAVLSFALPPEWVRDAACRDSDPDLFFPISETGPGARQVAAAKAVCAACPVAARCLGWAADTGQADGIWGGHTPAERAVLPRRRTARPQPVEMPEMDGLVLDLAAQGLSARAIADRLHTTPDEVLKARDRAHQRLARHRRRQRKEAAA